MLSLLSIIKGILIQNDADRTKEVSIEVDPTATSGSRTTILAKQTVNQTLSLPDATDTLVGQATADTLTNKQISGDNNTLLNINLPSLKADLAKANTVLTRDGAGNVVDAKTAPGGIFVGDTDAQSLTNKTIDASLNTISNITNAEIGAGAAIDATKISTGLVSNTEFDFLDGVTSNIQTQLDSKSSISGAVGDRLVKTLGTNNIQETGIAVDALNNVSGVNDLTVGGNLTVNGTTTTVNSATLDVADTNITVNKAGTDLTSEGAGLTIDRAGTKGSFIYANALASRFKIGDLGLEKEVADVSSSQAFTNKNLASSTNDITSASADSLTRATGNLSLITIPDSPIADNFVLESHTQTISNKTVNNSLIDLTGAASATNQLVVSSDTTSNLLSLPRKKGAIYFDDTTKKYKGDDGTNLIELGGSGQAGINYITNPDFETSLNDWNLYNDGASSVPVDGTGGTATLLSKLLSAPGNELRGTQSLEFHKAVGQALGEGISTDIKIDPFDQGKKINVSFEYSLGASVYSSGEFAVFVYDITNATLLGRITNDDNGDILAASNPTKFQGYFFAATNSVDYRIIIHRVQDINNNSLSMFIDSVKASPDQLIPGAIITEWQDYTPIFNAGFNPGTNPAVNKWQWRRVGQNMEIKADLVLGTTPSLGTGVFTFSLPSGYTIDPNKSPWIAERYGSASAWDSGGSGHRENYKIVKENSTTFKIAGRRDDGINADWTATFPFNWGANDEIHVWALSVPIQGWSSGVLQSTTDTLFTATHAKVASDGTTTLVNGIDTLLDFKNVLEDDFNIYNPTTGEFTAPKSGLYDVKCLIASDVTSAGNALQVRYFINGVSPIDGYIALSQNSTHYVDSYTNGSGIVKLKAGDKLTFKSYQNTGSNSAVLTVSWISVTYRPDLSAYSVFGESKTLESIVADGPVVGGADTWLDYTTLTVEPGEWDFDFQYVYTNIGAVTNAGFQLAISKFSGNTTTDHVKGDTSILDVNHKISGEGGTFTMSKRGVIVTQTTTFYFKHRLALSTTNVNVAGRAFARKVK